VLPLQDSLVVTVMLPALTMDDEVGRVVMPMTKIRDAVQVGDNKHPRLWPASLGVCVCVCVCVGGGG
jgi:hypothetical protein